MEKGILLISRTLSLTLSAPKCNYNLALALAKLGYNVTILTSIVDLQEEDFKRLVTSGVKIRRVPKFFAKRWLSPIAYTVASRIMCRDYVKIANGYTFWDDVTWVHFLRKQALKLMDNIIRERERGRLRRETWAESKIIKSSKKLWAVSSLVKESLVRDYGISEDKVFVLPNGVDVEKYKPIGEEVREKFRRELGLDDKVVLIFVGADPIRKGFDLLLKALKNITKPKDYTLIAVGFEQSMELKNASSGFDVRFLGKISEEALIRYYQVSDALVLPSRYDPFSLVTMEAMACGCIPVVSIVTGSRDVILRHNAGFVVNIGDVNSLVNVLEELRNITLDSLRAKAIDVAHKYSWSKIAERLFLII